MAMLTASSLIAELDVSLAEAPGPWRHRVLRGVIDLFLGNVEFYADDHIVVFDDVICRLIVDIERALLIELSNRLAPVPRAPARTLGTLARNRDPAVCGPILSQARTLLDSDLAEIAGKEQIELDLLLKIATRAELGEAVTDVLLKRGHPDIRRAIIVNATAHISEIGYARLVANLNGDKKLAAAIAARDNVPAELQPFLTAALET
jgi:uncharacterized protein (DUF2336 family)